MTDKQEGKEETAESTEKVQPKYELKVSRMDPLNTYEIGALALQLAETLENAAQFQADADAYYEQAKSERLKAKNLQVIIKKVNERDKRRRAEAAAEPK